MKFNTKIKKIFIGMIVVFLVILIGFLWPYIEYISIVTLGNINAQISSNENKKRLVGYLEKTYNEDFEIIDYKKGRWNLWGGKGAYSLIVRSKEYGNYLFEISGDDDDLTIRDERNTYHYGYIIKKAIENKIISKYSNLETITYATIDGRSVSKTHLSTEENEINKIIDELCFDDDNKIAYKITINNSTIADKNQLIDMAYDIYQYLWKTRCYVYFSIRVVDDKSFKNAKDNPSRELNPLVTGSNDEMVYLDYFRKFSSSIYYLRDNKEDAGYYLSKEELANLINREWILSSSENN